MRILTTLAALAAALPAAAQTITITTPERTHTASAVEIKELMGELILEIESAGKKTSLKCMDVVDMSLAPLAVTRSPGAADVQLVLWTGDSVFGTLLDPNPAKEGVNLQSASLGETVFGFDQVESVRFLANRGMWPRRRPDDAKTDVVITRSQDVRSGTLVSVGKAGVVYKSKVLRGKEVTVKPEETAIVYTFEGGRQLPDAPKTLFAIVQMTDGTALQGTIAELKGGALTFTDLYGNVRKVGAGSVGGLYFKNGRVMYLSDLAGDSVRAVENANYIRDPAKTHPSDKAFPWQRDRNVKWGKLSIRDREFRKGIGVHSKSELTFDVAGAYAKFEAMVGIDDCARDAECGSVVFVVLADGKKIWDSGPVTWRDRAKTVSVPIAGAQKLTLLVDWGEDFESGDYADWALARVIK
jgi:hypothetical protein